MKQEFVTLYGKAIVERNSLYLRSPYMPFEKTAFAQIGYQLFWVLIFVIQFFYQELPRKYVGIIVFGALLLFRLPYIYDAVFKRSYTSRIPLTDIRDITTQDDVHGMQTEVKLQLKNGRYKKILFRKLENQHEAFLAAITFYSVAQPAA